MTNRAIFLDRDGTINVNTEYTHKIKDLEFIDLAVEGLEKLQKTDYKLIIITNQSGIARGYYTEQDYFLFRDKMHKKLKEKGIEITAEYFCPHCPEEQCACRKPKTGMLEQAAKDFDLDLKKCWMIGDALSDMQTGKNAGCKTIHVLTGGFKGITDYEDFTAKNLLESADYIIRFDNKNK